LRFQPDLERNWLDLSPLIIVKRKALCGIWQMENHAVYVGKDNGMELNVRRPLHRLSDGESYCTFTDIATTAATNVILS
jgi:hypothetical protein